MASSGELFLALMMSLVRAETATLVAGNDKNERCDNKVERDSEHVAADNDTHIVAAQVCTGCNVCPSSVAGGRSAISHQAVFILHLQWIIHLAIIGSL